jgi:hypothetical protein
MQSGVCLHRRRADVFRRQGFQERAQAVQGLQSQALSEPGPKHQYLPTSGNQNDLLAVRKGNHSSFPPDAGTARVLPRMFPTAAVHEPTGLTRGRNRDRSTLPDGAAARVSPLCHRQFARSIRRATRPHRLTPDFGCFCGARLQAGTVDSCKFSPEGERYKVWPLSGHPGS